MPGGFGERGAEGKIAAVTYARSASVPFFGICFGMQMACIEAARNLAGINGAGSTEFGPAAEPVVGLLTEWEREGRREQRGAGGDLGGTMRLGAYPCLHRPGQPSPTRSTAMARSASAIATATRSTSTTQPRWSAAGLRFSGMSPDGRLPEIIEMPDHPWFVGVQFHPELKSQAVRAASRCSRRSSRRRSTSRGWCEDRSIEGRGSREVRGSARSPFANDRPFVLIAGPCRSRAARTPLEMAAAAGRDHGRA